MRFIEALHRSVDFFCDRCPSNTADFANIFDYLCPFFYFWEVYHRLHLWEEPYREVKYGWPASVFGQEMSEQTCKYDQERRERKRRQS